MYQMNYQMFLIVLAKNDERSWFEGRLYIT